MKRIHLVHWLSISISLSACIDVDEPDSPLAESGSEVIAKTGKRSRGSNSQEKLSGDRYLSDFNADGVTDLIRFAATQIYVNSAEYGAPPILSWDVGRPVRQLITGDFHGDHYDQVCAIIDDGTMPCYAISADRQSAWWWFTQGSFVAANEDAIVGDFDGDGRDDIFVYNRTNGAMRMYAMKGAYGFYPMPSFSIGNLAGLPGGLQIRAGDFGGDGREDLMVVNAAGQVIYYFSLFDGTNHTFWWAFSSAGVVGANDQVTVGRIDDNQSDDIVLRNRTTGATRFHRMEFGGGYPPQITTVVMGDLASSGNGVIRFAPYRGVIGEPGGTNRDGALVFGNGMLVRDDARWDGTRLTYWWRHTFFENPLPVSLNAQETGLWCWAATGQMIMSYLGHPVSQCAQANAAFGRSDCCNTPTPAACVRTGWPELWRYGFGSQETPGGTALSWAALRSEIQSNRPVAFSWCFAMGGGCHIMVAIGAKTVGISNFVTVNDPAQPNWGGQSDLLYSAYVSGSGYSHLVDIYNITKL